MFLENPELIEKYRQKAIELVTRKYSWKTVTESYITVYKKVIKKTKVT